MYVAAHTFNELYICYVCVLLLTIMNCLKKINSVKLKTGQSRDNAASTRHRQTSVVDCQYC